LAIFWSLWYLIGPLYLVLLAQLAVSFPTGQLRTRWDRGVVASAYAWYVLGNVLLAFTWNPVFPGQRPFEHNVFYAFGSPHLNDVVGTVTAVGSAAVAALVAGTVVPHWMRASKAGRRAPAPAVAGVAPPPGGGVLGPDHH